MNKEVVIDDIKLIPYKNKNGDVKSFILGGIDTYPYRQELKELNGIWSRYIINPHTKIRGVWLFSLKNKSSVINWANQIRYSLPEESTEEDIVEIRDEWITPEDKNFLLLPLNFRVPTLNEILNNIDEFKDLCTNECNNNLENKLIENSFECLGDRVFGKNEIIIIYKILHRYYNISSNKENLLRDSFKQFQFYLNDPLRYFLFLTGYRVNNTITFTNSKFQKLFDEVVRDNIVTNDERNYLIEKADYYGVDTDLVIQSLNNPKKNNSSFLYLINEVCEDGVITDAERKFVNEKATEYNFDKEEVNKILSER